MKSELSSLRPLSALDRRTFVTTALVSGFAAATLPVQASAISTDSAGLYAGETKIKVRDGELPAYAAKPVGGKNLPVVIVIQEIFGVHEHIRDVCRRFAKLGAYAIAPELFARQGNPATVADMQALMRDIVSKVPDAQVMADLDETVAFARANGGRGKVAITGFCWGGRITWLYAAHQPRLRAGVAWYGRLSGAASPNTPQHPLDLATRIKAPVLGLYGAADTGIPVSDVERMKQALSAARDNPAAQACQFVVYPDTPHAFHADYRPTYRPGPAQDGWSRAQAWFKQHL